MAAVAVAILLPFFALALALKLLSRWLLAPWPKARNTADRYAIWTPIPALFIVLLFVAWPLALVLGVVTVVFWIAIKPGLDGFYGKGRLGR